MYNTVNRSKSHGQKKKKIIIKISVYIKYSLRTSGFYAMTRSLYAGHHYGRIMCYTTLFETLTVYHLPVQRINKKKKIIILLLSLKINSAAGILSDVCVGFGQDPTEKQYTISDAVIPTYIF